MNVSLTAQLESYVQQKVASGMYNSASEVMRDALTAYLAQPPVTGSAWALGQGFFGRYSGPEDLAENRKSQLADAWSDKHAQRT